MLRHGAALLLAALALLCCAMAEECACFRMESRVLAGLRGREMSVVFERTRASGDGVLALLDEDGAELGKRRMQSQDRLGSISFRVPDAAPDRQTLRLVFRSGHQEDVQGEYLLAAASPCQNGVCRGDPRAKKIALTFDSAYGMGRLDDLLRVLDQYHVKCTFFLQGDFVEAFPEATALIHEMGHEIGNHTMRHPDDIRTLGNDAIFEEIARCSEAIQAATGQSVTLYRPPSGYSDYRDRAIAKALGCDTILWTADSLDGFLDTSRPEDVWNALVRAAQPGAILLLHVYGYYTPELLAEYLPLMQEKGYSFVTVSDLLGDAPRP